MKLLNEIIRPEIRNLVRIKDTSEDRFEYLRLDKNECLQPFDEVLLNAFKNSITFEDISGYPELDPLYRALARYVGVSEEQLFLSAGSDIGIRSIYEACIEQGDNVVLPAPSYAMFRVYAEMYGARFKMFPLNNEWKIDIDEMLNLVDNDTKLFVLENPNGSVGTNPTEEEIEKCASELLARNVLLLIDEVYFYVHNSVSKTHLLIEKYPNIIVVQSFSKSHGLAGLRIGYLIGNKDVINYVSRVRPMHEITSLTACATKWVLDNPGILHNYQKSILESKEYLKGQFGKLDISSKDTKGNFVLIYVPDKGKTQNLAEKLKRHKILIRRPFEESYLEGWTRVTIPEMSGAKRFIQALKRELGAGNE